MPSRRNLIEHLFEIYNLCLARVLSYIVACAAANALNTIGGLALLRLEEFLRCSIQQNRYFSCIFFFIKKINSLFKFVLSLPCL